VGYQDSRTRAGPRRGGLGAGPEGDGGMHVNVPTWNSDVSRSLGLERCDEMEDGQLAVFGVLAPSRGGDFPGLKRRSCWL
jgi:hypothetical protein